MTGVVYTVLPVYILYRYRFAQGTVKGDKAWYLVEVHKIYPEEIEVIYYTTPREHLDGYETATHEQCQRSRCRLPHGT